MLVNQAPATTAHVVNFYDTDDELIYGAAAFLADGLRDGEVVLALATEAHRNALARELRRDGLDIDELEYDGFYVPLDAATVMRSFVVDGSVDRELARKSVLPFALAAAAKHRPVRAFGEVVSMMLQSGQLEEAVVIEQVRTQMAEEFGCTLYCAYPSRLVHDERSLHVLESICAHHTHVVAPASYHATKLSSGSPVSIAAQSFLPLPDAIGAARNFVMAAMRGWEVSEFVIGTVGVSVMQVLASVLDAHLRAFRIGLSVVNGGVRVQIEYPVDEADQQHAAVGGFALLDRVAKEWGAEHNRDTRVIWAVFT